MSSQAPELSFTVKTAGRMHWTAVSDKLAPHCKPAFIPSTEATLYLLWSPFAKCKFYR